MFGIPHVALIAGYTRYRQINFYLENATSEEKESCTAASPDWVENLQRRNFVSWIVFLLSTFGFVLIGNFRLNELPYNHLIGAGIAFTGISIYSCMMVRTQRK